MKATDNFKELPLAHVVCANLEGIIGDRDSNDLPWKCEEDMDSFRSTTDKSIVIMGFNTYASIKHETPKNICLSNSPVLTERISIVIVDLKRISEHNKKSLVTLDTVPTFMGYIEDHFIKNSTFKGFTIFVPDLKTAVESAVFYKCILEKYVEQKPSLSEWVDNAKNTYAYIIGGEKLFIESMKHYNIKYIYLNELDVKLPSSKGKYAKYLNPECVLRSYELTSTSTVSCKAIPSNPEALKNSKRSGHITTLKFNMFTKI